jgi:hypothetical protein
MIARTAKIESVARNNRAMASSMAILAIAAISAILAIP